MAVPERHCIIDTDVGCDDALAILLALYCPTVKVEAITTVFGNVSAEQSAINVATLTTLAKQRDIKIYLGAAQPLLSTTVAEPWAGHGPNGLGGYTFEAEIQDIFKSLYPDVDTTTYSFQDYLPKPEAIHASQALIEMVKARPQHYDLICLGPLTNVALACKLDPLFPSYCKSLHWMGGSAYGKGNCTMSAEFNAYADPEAVSIVFESFPSGSIICTPWEICRENGIPWNVYDQLMTSAIDVRVCEVTKTEKIITMSKQSPFVRYVIKRITTCYERYDRGYVDLCNGEYDYIEDYSAEKYKASASLFCPADTYCMIGYLYPELVVESITKHSAIETSSGLMRGAIAVDWYGSHADKNAITWVTKIDYQVFMKHIQELTSIDR